MNYELGGLCCYLMWIEREREREEDKNLYGGKGCSMHNVL